MRYFKIEGILEIDESKLTDSQKENLLDTVNDAVIETLNTHIKGTFGGGIKEVDSEGNYI
jgi:hypothetical protein